MKLSEAKKFISDMIINNSFTPKKITVEGETLDYHGEQDVGKFEKKIVYRHSCGANITFYINLLGEKDWEQL